MILTSLTLLAACSLAAAANLPSDWKVCKQEDPNEVNKCLKEILPNVITELVQKGNKKFGILPLEPLRFTRLGIDSRGPVSINLTLLDLDVGNVKSFHIEDVSVSWPDSEINITVSFSESLKALGSYDISGKVLLLPIVGSGKCNLTLDGVKALFWLSGHEITKQKKIYMHFKQGTFDLTTTRLHINLENLFKGDKALGDNMNKFLNENWSVVFDEIRSGLAQAIGEALKTIANRVFSKVPRNEIIPE